MDTAYVFAAQSGDFGRWAYYMNGDIKSGESKGTTKDQMYLMGILQILRDENVGDDIQIHISDERTYKRLVGEYKKKAGIITDYLNEIGWATGNKKIAYIYIQEKELTAFPFYTAIQRCFQGQQGIYFDIKGQDSNPFEVEDPFNGNTLKGYLCRIADTRYGMLYIEYVNDDYCPQWIWATPKIRYPFDMNGVYNKYDVDKIELYAKIDGTNILAYIYEDFNGMRYVTYKTRLTPIVKDGTFGRFEKLWRELLEQYPNIPKFCLENNVNASFEMYGSKNPILIQYDIRLDAALLFCRTSDGILHPPSFYDLNKYGLKSAELWKVLNSPDNFEIEYKNAVEELNAQLKVTEMPGANDIVKGWEGAVWYAIKGLDVIPLKCKPDYIRDIHFLAASGIPKHSIYITCMNAFESQNEPILDDILNLLREEFTEEQIQRKIKTIETIYAMVYEQIVLRHKVIEEYEEHPEFNIVEDKGSVMRYFSKKYDKNMMSRIYSILWNEFGIEG